MSIKIAGESLNACSGCEIALLDMGDNFLKLLNFADIIHMPLLMDSKHGVLKTGDPIIKLPMADVGLISGGIKTRDHLEVAKAMRNSCNLIIALGTCATHGGIPSLANTSSNDELLKCCFDTLKTDTTDNLSFEQIPELMDTCSAVDEHIDVDIYLPGCPPHPDHIFDVLQSIEKKVPINLPAKSVCDNCPATRNGKDPVKKLKSVLDLPAWKTSEQIQQGDKCFLEQGFLCMGPVTRDGCGGHSDPPRCIMAQVPCRGCYGPVSHDGNQRLAMLNAFASNGIDFSTLKETISMLRFSGGHGLLCPPYKIKESDKDDPNH